MAGTCQTEMNGLPILLGCPADTELVLVMNSTATGNSGGYGLRYIKALRQCFLAGLDFIFNQFTIGQGGSPMSNGDTVLVITQSGILEDSLNIILEGTVLDRNDPTQMSYIVDYSNPNQITITFIQGVQTGQTYIIIYTVAT